MLWTQMPYRSCSKSRFLYCRSSSIFFRSSLFSCRSCSQRVYKKTGKKINRWELKCKQTQEAWRDRMRSVCVCVCVCVFWEGPYLKKWGPLLVLLHLGGEMVELHGHAAQVGEQLVGVGLLGEHAEGALQSLQLTRQLHVLLGQVRHWRRGGSSRSLRGKHQETTEVGKTVSLSQPSLSHRIHLIASTSCSMHLTKASGMGFLCSRLLHKEEFQILLTALSVSVSVSVCVCKSESFCLVSIPMMTHTCHVFLFTPIL